MSTELQRALHTSLPPEKWLIAMLADFEKIPLIEEYLSLIADGKLATCSFEPGDTTPDNRLITGNLKMEIGNPFYRPLNTRTSFPMVPGNFMDLDG